MNTPLNILHIDDNLFDRQLVRDALEHENGQFIVTSAASRVDYEAKLALGGFDLVLTDFHILGFEGLQVIDDVHEKYPTVPVIVVTGTGSEEVAVEAMKRGAADYVIKTPQHIRRLPLAIQGAMEVARLRVERLQSEAKLRMSEERLRAFANALPDLAFIMDEDGRYLHLLSTPENLLYTSAESQRGKLVHEVLPGPIADQIIVALRRVIETGTTQAVEYQLELPAGPTWFETRISRMATVSGEKALAVYVARNITDRKLAEQALQASQQNLEKRNRVLMALYEIGHALSATLDFEQICWTIYREFAQRLFDASHFVVVLYDETTGLLVPRFAVKDGRRIEPEQLLTGMLDQGSANEVVRTRNARVVNAPSMRESLPTAALYAPLVSGDHVIGVMAVQLCTPDVFRGVDLTLVETIANQSAVALANARLYEQAQQEIRERRQAEIKLARERNLLRTLIDNVPDHIFVVDRQGRFIASNIAHAAAAHRSPVEVIGKTSQEVFSPNLDEGLHHDDAAIMDTGEALINEELLLTNDQGNPQWILATKIPLHNENGDVIGLVGVSRDITKRKQDEAALQASEEHLRAVVSGAPVILFAVDKDGVITLLQGQGLDRIGSKPEAVIGKSIFEFEADVFPAMRVHFESALRGEETGFIFTYADIVFAVHCSVLRNQSGEVSEIMGVANDITERLKAERLQIEMEKEQEVIALKERFLAMASHDFRTPLSIIKMSANILQSFSERLTPEMRAGKLQQIVSQTNHMTQLLDDVLTMSKANAGKLDFEPERVGLRSFCEQIWDNFEHIAGKTHTLDFVYSAHVDEVVFDPNLIRQILVNLLSNAIKYTPQNGYVRFEVSSAGDELCFRVSDSGIGIPEKDQAKLFEPFHRASNTRGIEGTGLGLSIVKSYVEIHGGRISVESKEREGTTFLVYIPGTACIDS